MTSPQPLFDEMGLLTLAAELGIYNLEDKNEGNKGMISVEETPKIGGSTTIKPLSQLT